MQVERVYPGVDSDLCFGAVREPAAAYNIRETNAKDVCARRTDKAGVVQESVVGQVYDPEKRSGTYILEDYYAIPDERRVELIDGVFYDMAAPSVIHQLVLGEIYFLFRECISTHNKNYRILVSPCDVRLDKDDRTIVQPDLMVLCREVDLNGKRIEGAPDLTLEVLSPSTRTKDMLLKLYKYANAGVREYWIVDPECNVVLVYDLDHKDYYPKRYDFKETIPILISDGECVIDFSRVRRILS